MLYTSGEIDIEAGPGDAASEAAPTHDAAVGDASPNSDASTNDSGAAETTPAGSPKGDDSCSAALIGADSSSYVMFSALALTCVAELRRRRRSR